MVYYHVGRVIEVLKPGKDVKSSDSSVQAVVETWDENVITFNVHTKLKQRIRPGDYVLIDYTPISEKIVMPKMLIIKIISGDKAKKIWEAYKEYYRRRPRCGKPSTPTPRVPQQMPRGEPTYLG